MPRETVRMRQPAALIATMVAVVGLARVDTGTVAQGIQYGTIRGKVTDPHGLPIPSVTVTATSPSMQGPRVTATGPDGTLLASAAPFRHLRIDLRDGRVRAREAHDRDSARSDRRAECAASDSRRERTGADHRRGAGPDRDSDGGRQLQARRDRRAAHAEDAQRHRAARARADREHPEHRPDHD